MWAKDLMEPNVVTIRKETPVREVAKLMLKHKISGLPVVDRLGNVLGVVSELDLMHKAFSTRKGCRRGSARRKSIWDARRGTS